jgi:hypothetical protein
MNGHKVKQAKVIGSLASKCILVYNSIKIGEIECEPENLPNTVAINGAQYEIIDADKVGVKTWNLYLEIIH